MPKPLWEYFNTLDYAWAALLTHTLYRLAFRRVGPGTVIWPPIQLHNTRYVEIGARVSIRQGARFDLVTERNGHRFSPHVTIGDGTSIEQNFHLACGQAVHIGCKVAVTENVGVFDIWHQYQDARLAIVEQPLATAPVTIGDETFIGMGAVIQPGVAIGRHCVIGANSVVTRSIPDYSVAVGAPARCIKRYAVDQQKWINL